MKKIVKIGNAQAFWGDRTCAAEQLVRQVPDLDFLTMDYLAELSMSILAIQKEKNPALGYAGDFVSTVSSLVPHWRAGKPFRLISNAGGLNPMGCALACREALRDAQSPSLKIAVISGDDLLAALQSSGSGSFAHLDTGRSIEAIRHQLVTANAYMGAKPLVEALTQGASIIITGRVADPSLTAAPCIAHYGWKWDDYDKIAAATIAGHLIECGTQVTGGFSTHWSSMPSMVEPGYPIVEMEQDGSFIVTKSKESDGAVTFETVKEQLLYEIQDPGAYLSPDATVSFLSLQLEQEGPDRIRVIGAKGSPPPKDFKVSATYRNGYKIEGMIALYGRGARSKGIQCGEIIRQRLQHLGCLPASYHVECIGSGDIVPGIATTEPMEVMLRIAAKDSRKEPLEALAKEIAPLVTSGPQGVTGYSSGRPKPRPLFSFWPTLISAEAIKPRVEIIEV